MGKYHLVRRYFRVQAEEVVNGAQQQVWTTTLTAPFCQLADAYQLVSRRLRRANLPMPDQRNGPPTPLTLVESFGKDAGE